MRSKKSREAGLAVVFDWIDCAGMTSERRELRSFTSDEPAGGSLCECMHHSSSLRWCWMRFADNDTFGIREEMAR